jgi:quercetin dioxygenase-like cupin family protein
MTPTTAIPITTIPVARFDLQEEVRAMRSTIRPGGARHVAKTLARAEDLRLVLIVMQPGARIHEHATEGRLTIQGVDGRVRLHVHETVFEIDPGFVLAIDRDVPHALEAMQDSSILLTIAWPGHHEHDVAFSP